MNIDRNSLRSIFSVNDAVMSICNNCVNDTTEVTQQVQQQLLLLGSSRQQLVNFFSHKLCLATFHKYAWFLNIFYYRRYLFFLQLTQISSKLSIMCRTQFSNYCIFRLLVAIYIPTSKLSGLSRQDALKRLTTFNHCHLSNSEDEYLFWW